ncbi:hypothetical protein AB0958_13005 [Streptomyces sp. NPDC006655]|uniref:hypothetical protein n=1 Tax=Streptomyces sp. NPDC006655 TaxID=3156898 RepID=UPI003455119C
MDQEATTAQLADLVSFDKLLPYFTGIGEESAPHLHGDPFSGGTAQFYPANSPAQFDLADSTRTNRTAVVTGVLIPFATPTYCCMFRLT